MAQLLFALIFPLWALPWVLWRASYRGRYAQLVAAVTIASLGYFMIPSPSEDLYRHIATFEALSTQTIAEAIQSSRLVDIGFTVYAWSLSHIGAPAGLLSGLVVFLGYLLWFRIFQDFVDASPCRAQTTSRLRLIMAFALMALGVSFLSLANGIRSGLAFIVVIYGAHLYELRHRYISVFVSIFGILFHPAALPVAVLLYAGHSTRLRKFYIPIIWIALIGFFLSPILSSTLAHLGLALNNLLNLQSSEYFEIASKWGGGISNYRSLKGLLYDYFVARAPLYVVIYYLLTHRAVFNSYWLRCTALMLFLVSWTSPYYTLSLRYIAPLTYAFILYLVWEHINSSRLKPKIRRFIITLISVETMTAAANVYSFGSLLFIGWISLLYLPLPIAMNFVMWN